MLRMQAVSRFGAVRILTGLANVKDGAPGDREAPRPNQNVGKTKVSNSAIRPPREATKPVLPSMMKIH
jgi:hypothetical protein